MRFVQGLTCTAPLANLLTRQNVPRPDQDEPELFPIETSGTNILEDLGLGDIPEVGGGRPVRWNETNRIPKACLDVVRTPGNVAGNCDLSQMEVYDVEYDDCEGEPWTICRCPDADEDVERLANDLGQLAVGARDYVRYVVMSADFIIDDISYVEGAALPEDGDLMIYGNWSSVGLFVHESAHLLDFAVMGEGRTMYSYTNEWEEIVDSDTCLADWYSKASYTEAFAQGAVLVAYDINNSGPLEDIVDFDCASNVHSTITEQLGDYYRYDASSTCQNRHPRSRDVCLTGRRWAFCDDDEDVDGDGDEDNNNNTDEDQDEDQDQEEDNDDGSETEDGTNDDDPRPTDNDDQNEDDNSAQPTDNGQGGDNTDSTNDDNANDDDESDASRPSALVVFKVLAVTLRAIGLL